VVGDLCRASGGALAGVVALRHRAGLGRGGGVSAREFSVHGQRPDAFRRAMVGDQDLRFGREQQSDALQQCRFRRPGAVALAAGSWKLGAGSWGRIYLEGRNRAAKLMSRLPDSRAWRNFR